MSQVSDVFVVHGGITLQVAGRGECGRRDVPHHAVAVEGCPSHDARFASVVHHAAQCEENDDDGDTASYGADNGGLQMWGGGHTASVVVQG